MLRNTLVYFFLLSLPVISFSQAIYSGGSGGGSGNSCYTQPSNAMLDLYSGGNADGYSSSCYTQPDNVAFNIYNGGSADGFSYTCYTQPDNVAFNIYNGGDADGFTYTCYTQPDNVAFNIYNGGSADGFSYTCYTQPDNVLYNIYSGGSSDGFAVVCIGAINVEVPLPVELLYFSAACNPADRMLHWSTASESNNDYFTLERSSNGTVFNSIGAVNGGGNTNQLMNYFFTDTDPLSGTAYYRLGQTDFNGNKNYLDVIASNCEKNPDEVSINPNPTHGTFQVSFVSALTSGEHKVTICNALGKIIFETSHANTTSIDLSGQPAGVYMLKIQSVEKTYNKKIVLQ